MLSKFDWFKVTLAGALVVGLGFGADTMTTSQTARIAKLKAEASGTLDSAAINEAHTRKVKNPAGDRLIGQWFYGPLPSEMAKEAKEAKQVSES